MLTDSGIYRHRYKYLKEIVSEKVVIICPHRDAEADHEIIKYLAESRANCRFLLLSYVYTRWLIITHNYRLL